MLNRTNQNVTKIGLGFLFNILYILWSHVHQINSPELALYPLGQIMSHLNWKVLTVQRLHLVEGISLQLLGLDPHCHLQHP